MRLAVLAATAALVAGMGAAVAQSDIINQRQTILKTFGAQSRDPGAMLRGEAPFDLAKVKTFLATLKTESPKLAQMFPDGSLGVAGTKAQANIGAERAQFAAIWTKLAADATAAETAITNDATLKTELPKVLANCGACHRPYRAQ
jgi:cytochrome c556